jgi:hypothetical protein
MGRPSWKVDDTKRYSTVMGWNAITEAIINRRPPYTSSFPSEKCLQDDWRAVVQQQTTEYLSEKIPVAGRPPGKYFSPRATLLWTTRSCQCDRPGCDFSHHHALPRDKDCSISSPRRRTTLTISKITMSVTLR